MKTFSAVAIATLTMVGVSSAQTKAPAPAKMPAKVPAKVPAKAASPTLPLPPPELGMMAKSMVGYWRCKGEEWDMKAMKGRLTATSIAKLDLDKWWIVDTMQARGRMTFKMVSYTTYDPTAKKWRRVAMMNDGGYMIGTSDGMKENKMTWNMDVVSPMGAGMFRDHVDSTDAKAGVKVWGEMSMDKGRTWNKMYEMTCRK
jgi:hypothetical protein